MKNSPLTSRPASLVCPLCEEGKLRPSGHNSMCCDSCSGFLSGAMLQTLWQIDALPDALGSHACECGHPEMRRLPDGVYHCPACGSEVLPTKTTLDPKRAHLGSTSAWNTGARLHPDPHPPLRIYSEEG